MASCEFFTKDNCFYLWVLGALLIVAVAVALVVLSACLCRLHRKVRKLERNLHRAQLLDEEPHYASLQKLPCGEGTGLSNREGKGSKEDPSSDYTCIAKNRPT